MSPNRFIEVIVSPVRRDNGWDINRNPVWTCCGDEILRHRFADPSEARAVAMDLRRKKRSVIIRPNFNEPHLTKRPVIGEVPGYREWRSFDGGLFSEIHFLPCGEQSTMIRLDAEVVLPPIP